MSSGPPSDEDLVERARAESDPQIAAECINTLFERYYARVAAWCLRLTGDRETALDLAQDVFLKAYRNLGSFRSESRFSTWLYVIARNHCFNHLKSRARGPVEAGEEHLQGVADAFAESGTDSLEREEARRRVAALLAQLDDVERKVMVLHYGEELPLRAVTSLLRLRNRSGAKAYIVSARRKLKRAVERWKSASRR